MVLGKQTTVPNSLVGKHCMCLLVIVFVSKEQKSNNNGFTK